MTNHLPKALPLNMVTLGNVSTYVFVQDKNIQPIQLFKMAFSGDNGTGEI